MKTVYYLRSQRLPPTLASVHLWDFRNKDPFFGYVITGVETSPSTRRQLGWARRVMQQMLDDTDAEGVTLWLSINPDGSPRSLSYHQLRSWYERLGFVYDYSTGMFVRKPRSEEEKLWRRRVMTRDPARVRATPADSAEVAVTPAAVVDVDAPERCDRCGEHYDPERPNAGDGWAEMADPDTGPNAPHFTGHYQCGLELGLELA